MSDAAKRSRPAGLGRGLSALLGEMASEAPVSPGAEGKVRPACGCCRSAR